jgi:hypothetical protein
MPGAALTTLSSIQCPHGGSALLTTSNAHASAGPGARMLLETDTHAIVGCPFYNGASYSPCVSISWSAGASALSVQGTAVLVKSSVGQCKNPSGVVQGVAMVGSTQLPVSAT